MSARKIAAALFLALLLGAPALAAEAAPLGCDPKGLASYVEADLFLKGLAARGDDAALLAFYRDKGRPAPLRGLALRHYFKGKKAPLASSDRSILVEALADAEEGVRMAAVQSVSVSAEMALTQQVLQIGLAVGSSPDFQVQTLKAVRPWVKMTHLYFLEGALGSAHEEVRAEAVGVLSGLSSREVPPSVIARVESMLRPEEPASVRLAVLDAMVRWRRLAWDEVRGVILETTAPEMLRIHAIELSDEIPEALKARAPVLRDLVLNESSLPLTYRAFERTQGIGKGDREFIRAVARTLASTPLLNGATQSMALFLRAQGLGVEFRDGGWSVSGL